MSEREEQIQRLADAMKSGWDAARAHLDLATVMYLAGARIPDPTAPKTPEVVVSEEATQAYIDSPGVSGCVEHYNQRPQCPSCRKEISGSMGAAFPILLRDNAGWLVPSLGMCRIIVDEITRGPRGGRTEAEHLRHVLMERLAALGVAGAGV